LQSLLAPAPILILFSGGVDSTLIAALAHSALPPDVPIDLSNVCFVGGASPDRLAAHSALLELAAFAPRRQWRLIEVNSSLEEVCLSKLTLPLTQKCLGGLVEQRQWRLIEVNSSLAEIRAWER
jgi:NH3-dependent NAD+ synthetase